MAERMLSTRRKNRDEAGAIAILFAAGAVFLFVLAAIIVDLGMARDVRRDSQNAADSAALAAANRLYLTSTTPDLVAATQAAKDYAAANFGVTASDWNVGNCSDDDHLTVLAVGTQCISFDSATDPTTVRVRIPTEVVHTGLGTLADVDRIPVSAAAEVGVSAATTYKCALCFLDTVDAGNADFTVTGGGIQVNGDITTGPNAYWTAASIGATGTASGGVFTPPATQAANFTDPLAGLTLPAMSGANRGTNINCNGAIQPGVYGTLNIANNRTCTLNPGHYVITGRWLLGNKSVLQGSGVTLYFVCGTPATPAACGANVVSGGGWLDGKNGTVTLTSGASGFADYVILYDRNNPNDLGLQGNGGTSITGGVYVKRGDLDFNGNSCFGFAKGPIVAGGVKKANGNKSCVTVSDATDVTSGSQPGAIALSK